MSKKDLLYSHYCNKRYHGIMEKVNDLIPDYNIGFARPAFVVKNKIIFASLQ